MGVYIKGMEMPKSCLSCPLQGGTADCRLTQKTYNWGLSERPSDCPLAPVPPHGDLVDRAEIREIAISLLDKAVTDQEANAIREMWYHLGQMPVFIPAEEGE